MLKKDFEIMIDSNLEKIKRLLLKKMSIERTCINDLAEWCIKISNKSYEVQLAEDYACEKYIESKGKTVDSITEIIPKEKKFIIGGKKIMINLVGGRNS